jgi:hypothetical protein
MERVPWLSNKVRYVGLWCDGIVTQTKEQIEVIIYASASPPGSVFSEITFDTIIIFFIRHLTETSLVHFAITSNGVDA